jgi:hypothetical protein
MKGKKKKTLIENLKSTQKNKKMTLSLGVEEA